MFEIERITRDLREAVAGLDPACLEGRDAARLTEVAAEGEKLFGAAKALLAKRSADTNAWRSRSHAASPEQWLADATGTSESSARETFATATRLADLPTTEEKLRSGELSLQQAAHVTAGAAADPSAERRLLATARRSGMRELRAEKERVIAAVTDEVEARRKAKASGTCAPSPKASPPEAPSPDPPRKSRSSSTHSNPSSRPASKPPGAPVNTNRARPTASTP
jgi:hypothetical protein